MTHVNTQSRRQLVLPAILLAGFALGAYRLGAQSLWYDEAYSVMLAREGNLARIVAQTAGLDFNTPLHYVLLNIWLALTGTGEFAARYSSLLCASATVALCMTLAGEVTRGPRSVWARAAGGLATAFAPALLPPAQEARMYALTAALSCAAVLCLIRGMRTAEREAARMWIAWAILVVAAFLTHVLGAAVAGAQGLAGLVWWLRERDPRTRRISAIAALGAAAVMSAFVLFMLSFGTRYGVTFTTRPDPGDLLLRSAAALVLPRLLPESAVPFAAVAGVGVLALALLAPDRGRLAAISCVLGLLAFVLVGVMSGKFAPRYPVILAAPLLALAAATLAQRAPRTLFAVLGALLLAGAVYGALRWQRDPVYAFEDYRGAVAHIRANAGEDDAVLMLAGHADPAMAYYWPGGQRGRDWHALPDDVLLDVSHALDYDRAAPLLNAALTGKRGAWLLRWQDTVIDPATNVRTLLRRQSVRLQPDQTLTQFHGLVLEHYRFRDTYRPTPAKLPSFNMQILPNGPDTGLGAFGCMQFEAARIGEPELEVLCFWRLARAHQTPWDAQISLRLSDPSGQRLAQNDVQLAHYGLPYLGYDGSIVTSYRLPLDRVTRPGRYVFEAVPYTSAGEITPRLVTDIVIEQAPQR